MSLTSRQGTEVLALPGDIEQLLGDRLWVSVTRGPDMSRPVLRAYAEPLLPTHFLRFVHEMFAEASSVWMA